MLILIIHCSVRPSKVNTLFIADRLTVLVYKIVNCYTIEIQVKIKMGLWADLHITHCVEFFKAKSDAYTHLIA